MKKLEEGAIQVIMEKEKQIIDLQEQIDAFVSSVHIVEMEKQFHKERVQKEDEI